MKNKYFDKEEQEMMESIDKGEWIGVSDQEQVIKQLQEDAKEYFEKSDRINIKMIHRDLIKIKHLAAHEGLPYQTYIASQLHKLAEGRLKEKDQ